MCDPRYGAARAACIDTGGRRPTLVEFQGSKLSRIVVTCALLASAASVAAPVQAQSASCPSAPIASARGAVHYVCDCAARAEPGCRPGDDGNDGRSPERPFRSYEKARKTFGSAKAGDVIAFCRGGSFEVKGDTRWFAPGCRADQPCVIRDYDPPWHAEKKPELRVAQDGNTRSPSWTAARRSTTRATW